MGVAPHTVLSSCQGPEQTSEVEAEKKKRKEGLSPNLFSHHRSATRILGSEDGAKLLRHGC